VPDPLVNLPGYLLRRASAAALVELNQRLAMFGLHHTDVSLLLLIQANPGITQSEAGRILGIQRANMVSFINRLQKPGWIERRPVDGRSQGLSLSSAGIRITERAGRLIEDFEIQLLARVPAALQPHVRPILHYLWTGTCPDALLSPMDEN
jgi:DNA-binding MarR family transcriptional regulator